MRPISELQNFIRAAGGQLCGRPTPALRRPMIGATPIEQTADWLAVNKCTRGPKGALIRSPKTERRQLHDRSDLDLCQSLLVLRL
jgi:hypothetical protein